MTESLRTQPGGTVRPRVLVVIGTRPEGIKLAPVITALKARPEVQTAVALTGQHTDLVDQVLDVMQLQVDYELGIMREGQDLYDVASGCLTGLRRIVTESRPDLLIVQGDTGSVFFGALVGFFERMRIGHVEAGLRTGDKWRPYPEEAFRRLTSALTDLHFAPTARARANLLREGIAPETIFITGNTVVDALASVVRALPEPRDPHLVSALAHEGRLVLLTAHRRESFGAPLRAALEAVRRVADAFPDIVVLYPVHPNPNVREAVDATLAGHDRILLTSPLDYFDLLHALRAAALVITDSGGIQEEAPSFGAPVLVLREVTERPEAVEAGLATLVGTDPARIVAEAAARLAEGGGHAAANPYGDGRAGERIADIVVHALTGSARRTTDWQGP